MNFLMKIFFITVLAFYRQNTVLYLRNNRQVVFSIPWKLSKQCTSEGKKMVFMMTSFNTYCLDFYIYISDQSSVCMSFGGFLVRFWMHLVAILEISETLCTIDAIIFCSKISVSAFSDRFHSEKVCLRHSSFVVSAGCCFKDFGLFTARSTHSMHSLG